MGNCIRCGRGFDSETEIFRCVDCEAPLHRLCAPGHFNERPLPARWCAAREAMADLVDACYAEGSSPSWRVCCVCDTEHRPDEAYPGDEIHQRDCPVRAAESWLTKELAARSRSNTTGEQ